MCTSMSLCYCQTSLTCCGTLNCLADSQDHRANRDRSRCPFKPYNPTFWRVAKENTAWPIAKNVASLCPDSAQSSAVTQVLPSTAEAAPDARFSSLIGAPR